MGKLKIDKLYCFCGMPFSFSKIILYGIKEVYLYIIRVFVSNCCGICNNSMIRIFESLKSSKISFYLALSETF